jgi:hypothetical protein
LDSILSVGTTSGVSAEGDSAGFGGIEAGVWEWLRSGAAKTSRARARSAGRSAIQWMRLEAGSRWFRQAFALKLMDELASLSTIRESWSLDQRALRLIW